MMNETLSHKFHLGIFHFDWVSDGRMAHILSVKSNTRLLQNEKKVRRL